MSNEELAKAIFDSYTKAFNKVNEPCPMRLKFTQWDMLPQEGRDTWVLAAQVFRGKVQE